MKNQSGTIKTNLELYRVVKGGSGGYRRLPGGSAHFSLHTNRQTLHHNIYITIMMLRLIVIALKKSHQVFRRTKAVQKSHSPPVNALDAGSGKKIMGCLGNFNWC